MTNSNIFKSFAELAQLLTKKEGRRKKERSRRPATEFSEVAKKRPISTGPHFTVTKRKIASKKKASKAQPKLDSAMPRAKHSPKNATRIAVVAPAHAEPNKSTTVKPGTIVLDRVSMREFDSRLAVGPTIPHRGPSKTDIALIRDRSNICGTNFSVSENADGELIDVVIGLDVGSTAKKMVVRLPYAEDIGMPVIAPNWFRADDHPYYWRTLLWKAPDGRYSLEPEDGAAAIDRLKVKFINFGEGDRVAIKCAMVAWVVLMSRQALGWLRQERPKLFEESRVVVDEINLGMPFTKTSEAHADQIEVAAAASFVLENSLEVTEEVILHAFAASSIAPSDLVALQPELAGALHGFLNSHQRRDGRYLLADIGGLTIDTVLFGYREQAKPQITVFAKSVECFGSEIISKWCYDLGTEERATKVLGNHFAMVAKQALREKIRVSPNDWKKPFALETILIGGGRHSQPHRRSIGWCEQSMNNHAPPLALRLRDLEPDQDDLDMPFIADRKAGRLLVALGLSYSRHDSFDIRSPDEVANRQKDTPRDITHAFVGPEQM